MAESTTRSSTGVVVGVTVKAQIRVLHVDDEPGFLKVAKRCLEMEGAFKVDSASSAEEAMKKLRKKMFDVIVSDYVMPGKDGLEFLKELRQKGNHLPFILFTVKGREEVAMKALNSGSGQYRNKIGDPESVYGELAQDIVKAVKIRRVEEGRRETEKREIEVPNIP